MFELGVTILVTLCLIPGLLQRYIPLSSEISAKKKNVLRISYCAALLTETVVLYCLIIHVGFSVEMVKNICTAFAVVTVGINILVIRHRIREHLFIFGVVIVCNYLLFLVPSYIAVFVQEIDRPVRILLLAGIYFLLLATMYIPIRKLLKSTVEPFLHFDSGNYWNSIWFIPIALFGSMFLIFPENTKIESIGQLLSGVLSASIMILVCKSIAGDYHRMYEKQVVMEQLADQKLYYTKLQVGIEEARRARHDFKHYLSAIEHYLALGDMDALRCCCETLVHSKEILEPFCYIGSAVADSVISRYAIQAEEEGILFHAAGSLNADWLTDMDQCVLLGNALDNAIEGCRTCAEDRKIALTIHSDEETISVLVQNHYDGQLQYRDEQIMSRKEEERVGVGLQSIASICRKYNGYMEVCSDEKLFSLNILLHRPKAN